MHIVSTAANRAAWFLLGVTTTISATLIGAGLIYIDATSEERKAKSYPQPGDRVRRTPTPSS